MAWTLPATGPAHAQDATTDATWLASPGTSNLNDGANWSTGTVPTGTAFFGASTLPGGTLYAASTFGGWTFNADAPNYIFVTEATLGFTGAGITVNGGSVIIETGGTLNFDNTSTAGSASIQSSTTLNFNDASSAGTGYISTSGTTNFYGTSTAGSAGITNECVRNAGLQRHQHGG